jgi:hypothetical protein
MADLKFEKELTALLVIDPATTSCLWEESSGIA